MFSLHTNFNKFLLRLALNLKISNNFKGLTYKIETYILDIRVY